MIEKAQMDNVIEESYDLMAMVQISIHTLEAIEGNCSTPFYDRAVGDVRRTLTAIYKKANIVHDTLEGVDRHGFKYEEVASHG